MEQLKNLADSRLLGGCTYCTDGEEQTRDHVPSRVFLDAPYPTNLPVVPACDECNNGFSRDEAYLACLIECALAGTTEPNDIERPSIGRILRRSPALRARIEAQRTVVDGVPAFVPETGRVCNVVKKLARGHAAFELSLLLHQVPTSVNCWPILTMTAEERQSYDAAEVVEIIDEVGSRGMQRLYMIELAEVSQVGRHPWTGVLLNDWIDVQEGHYRYFASAGRDRVTVKIVLREYLACEVVWLTRD